MKEILYEPGIYRSILIKNVAEGRIFELDEIRRAAEVGVGVKSASEIKITPLDDESREPAEAMAHILETQG